MSPDEIQSKELDPDRTDQVPILEGTILDQDVADDAVPMERAPVSAVPLASPGPETLRVASDFARPPAVDLPSLTESVRSVEERIARQSAEHEALSRLYEKTRNAEGVAAARVNTLTEELAAARSALAMEQHRFQEAERALAEKNITAEHARKRADELIRD